MKLFVAFVLSLLVWSNSSFAQILFSENFAYTGTNGDSLTNPTIGGAVWKTHSGGGAIAKEVQFQNSSLSYGGYTGSGVGGSVTFQNNVRSQDVNAFIGSKVKTGALYASFMLKLDSSAAKDTATDYFFHLCDTSGTSGVTNFRGRVFVADGTTPGTYKIGLSKGTGAKLTAAQITAGARTPVFTSTQYNNGQTYLVVLKYIFNTTTTKDDSLALFVVSGTIPLTEPTATLTFQDTGVSDLKQIQSIVIRQGSTGKSGGTLDGFEVFSQWSDMLSTAQTFAITATAGANGAISPSGAVNVSSGTNQTFNITANQGYAIQDVLVDGASQGAIATYTFTNVTATHTISASFKVSTVTTYAITATAGANGTITPSGAVLVNSGANQSFTIAANGGYAIQDVMVDGVSQGAIATYTFSNVVAVHTISASFKVLSASGFIFSDNFAYTGADGDTLTNPAVGGLVWKGHSGGGSAAKDVLFQNTSLNFTGYDGSGLGGAVNFQNNARSQDINAFIGTNVTSGALYTSVLLRIDSSGGKDTATDYFFHYLDSSGLTPGSNFRGRVFVSDGSTSSTFKIGLSKGTAAKLTAANIAAGARAPVFSSTEFNIGQTYMIVLKYMFNTTTTKDDSLALFVISGAIPATEPAATITFQDTAVSDLKKIQSIVIREGGTGRTAGVMDGVKVFTSWSAIAPSTTTTSNIAGRIAYPNNKNVNGAKLTLSGAAASVGASDVTGNFSFTGLAQGNYTLKPSKNNDKTKNNGVSTIDIILTQSHILNKIPFTSPYKRIAADVNNDKKISTIDIIFMKRLILGTDTTFAGNRLWAFVDSAYVFPDTANPFPYKDSISYTGLSANKTNQTFIGVKLGDVDYNWNPLVAKSSKVNNTAIELSYTQTNTQGLVRIPINVKNFKSLLGMQYTLNFNNDAYEYVGIEKNMLNMNFNDKQAKDGAISFLWTDANNEDKTLTDGTKLFELVLKPKSDNRGVGSELVLSNDITNIEAYDKDMIQHDIVLAKAQTTTVKDMELIALSPNPTKGLVKLQLNTATDKTIQLVLTNSLGNIVFKQQLALVKGDNAAVLNLQKDAALTNGVYYLKTIGLEKEMVKQVIISSK